jgi:hypothetical protein
VPGISPFRPNYPIQPELFVGRAVEIQRLVKNLRQTAGGNPANFLVTGERGIGKSSLLNYVTALAEDRVTQPDEAPFHFLVVGTDVNPNTTPLALAEKIKLGFTRGLKETESVRKFFSEVWQLVTRVEAAGYKIGAKDTSKDLEEKVLEEFAYSLSDTVNRLCDPNGGGKIFDTSYNGVLLLIDEADRSAPELGLGAFLKTLTERLNKNGCERLMIGVGGLPELRQVLVASHRSSLRIFDQMFLERLSSDEVAEVIRLSLGRAHHLNNADYIITEEATDLLVSLAEGIPHFIQEFGHSAFVADSDYTISDDDVIDGAFDEHGAIDQIGSRYYRDVYNDELTDPQRRVLKAIAKAEGLTVPRGQLVAALQDAAESLDDTLDALIARGDLFVGYEGEDVDEPTYTFQSLAFSWWVERQDD